LKIKIKSLAAEAIIIRHEERKNSGDTRNNLHLHRVMVVRPEARASFIAYAYLRGRLLSSQEQPGSRTPDWANALRIAKRFSLVPFDEVAFREWAGIDEKGAIKKAA
jgi:hypothetical protein